MERAKKEDKPGWLNRFVWDTLWKVVAVGLAVAVGLVLAFRAQHLLALLVIISGLALSRTKVAEA